MKIRKVESVLVANGHIIQRAGLKCFLNESRPDINVTSLAEDLDAVLTSLKKRKVDLVIADIAVASGGNSNMIDKIRVVQPNVPILIFTDLSEKAFALPCLRAGADGFISKDVTGKELMTALKQIESRKKYISASLLETMLDAIVNRTVKDRKPVSQLSKREFEVANLLVKGNNTKQMSKLLQLQSSTISTVKARIFRKLGVSNLIEFVAKMGVTEVKMRQRG